MMDYTEWEEKAQAIFTEYLQRYAEFDPDYDINRIDPVLYFEDNFDYYGSCLHLHDEKYNFRIVLDRGSLFVEYTLRVLIVHELTHATAGKMIHGPHSYPFKKHYKNLLQAFGLNDISKGEKFHVYMLSLEGFDPDRYVKAVNYFAEKEKKRLERKAAREAKKQVK